MHYSQPRQLKINNRFCVTARIQVKIGLSKLDFRAIVGISDTEEESQEIINELMEQVK